MSSTYSVPQRRKQSPCRFRNLSRAEIETICNGCGGWFDPLERLMKVHGHEVASEFTAKEEEA